MPRWKLVLHVLQWIVFALGVMSLPIPLIVANEVAEPNPDWEFKWDQPSMRTITTVQRHVQIWIGRWLAADCLGAIALGVLGFMCRAGTILSWIACLAIGPAIIVASCAGALTNLAPWQYGPAIHGNDQKTYYVMESSFLQGQTLVLARLEYEGPLWRTSKVLVQTNGDSPRFWQSMVRPATDDDAGTLASHISPAGVLFGYRYENHCFFAYDLGAEIRFGRDRIRGVSPFALLGPETGLHEPDVARIEQIVRELDPRSSGVPIREQLEDGLRHPNPFVVALSKKLLEVRKE